MEKFFGTIEFYVAGDDIVSYLERMDRLFKLNKVTEAEDKVEYFLTLIGPDAYKKLKTLVMPAKIETKTYEQLKTALTSHYKPKTKVIAERFKFYSRKQKTGETINDFVLALKLLADSCDFKDVEEALRDKFVMGLADPKIQNKLLDEDNLTMEEAVAKSCNFELTKLEMQTIKTEQAEDLHYVRGRFKTNTKYNKGTPRDSSKTNKTTVKCFHCNGPHYVRHCPKKREKHFGNTTYGDSNAGSSKYFEKNYKLKNQHKVNAMQSEGEFVTRQIQNMQLNHIHEINERYSRPHMVQICIHGFWLSMEVDTGASTSIISFIDYKKFFSNIVISKCSKRLNFVTGQQVLVVGEIIVDVKMNKRETAS